MQSTKKEIVCASRFGLNLTIDHIICTVKKWSDVRWNLFSEKDRQKIWLPMLDAVYKICRIW